MISLAKIPAAYRAATTLEERQAIATDLVIEVRPRLWYFLASKCSQLDDVDDLCQEALAGIASKLHQCDQETDSGVRGWCYAIAKNKFMDYLRRKYAKPTSALDLALMSELVDDADEARRTTDEVREQAMFALELIRASDPEDAALVHSRYFDELTYNKLALVLGSTPDAVRMKVGRALEKAEKLVRAKLKHV